MPMHDRTMWKPSVNAICCRAASRSSAARTHGPVIAPTVPVARYRGDSSAHLLPPQPLHPELPDLLEGRERPRRPGRRPPAADRATVDRRERFVVASVFGAIVGRPAHQAHLARIG